MTNAEVVAFCDLVAEGHPSQVPGSAALEALRVAVAADRPSPRGSR